MSVLNLTGPIEEVSGGVHAEPGTILVLLKNGKPIEVIPPGRKYRGWLRISHMQALPVRAGSVELKDVTIRHVTTTDGYVLPSLALTARVAVNPANDYAGLVRRIHRDGPEFAGHVNTELLQEMDALVRAALSTRSHQEMYGQNLTGLFSAGQSLLDGLFVVEQVPRVDPTWDQVFVDTIAVEKNSTHDIYQAAAQARLQELEDHALIQRAALLNIGVDELINPELAVAREAGSHELSLESIRQDGELRRALVDNIRDVARAKPEVLAALLGQDPNPPIVVDDPPPPAELEVPSDRPDRAARPSRSNPGRLATGDLSRFAGLVEAWEELGWDGDDLWGGVYTEAPSALAVAVCDPGFVPDPSQRRKLATLLAEAVGSGEPRIDFVPYHRYLDRLVANFSAARLDPDHPASQPDAWTIEQAGNDLRLVLAVPSGHSARGLRRDLLDPEQLFVQPLSELLGASLTVEVEPQGG